MMCSPVWEVGSRVLFDRALRLCCAVGVLSTCVQGLFRGDVVGVVAIC